VSDIKLKYGNPMQYGEYGTEGVIGFTSLGVDISGYTILFKQGIMIGSPDVSIDWSPTNVTIWINDGDDGNSTVADVVAHLGGQTGTPWATLSVVTAGDIHLNEQGSLVDYIPFSTLFDLISFIAPNVGDKFYTTNAYLSFPAYLRSIKGSDLERGDSFVTTGNNVTITYNGNISGGTYITPLTDYNTPKHLIDSWPLHYGDQFYSGDGSDFLNGAGATAKGSALVTGDTFTVGGVATADYINPTITFLDLDNYGIDSSNILFLTGNMRPSFSDDTSESFYSFPQAKPKYITTERYFPSVEKQYNICAMKKADRDLLYAFWNEKLSYGENMFTLIDHRQRCLFNALWDTFGAPESWQANRNAHNLTMKMQNPFGWTLPMYAAYLFENSNYTDYLGGSGLTVSCASLVNHATDSDVLRETGSALKMIASGVINQIGAEAYPAWTPNSFSIFCQVRFYGFDMIGAFLSTKEYFDIFKLTNGEQSVGITCGGATNPNDAHAWLVGFIRTASSSGYYPISRSDASYACVKCPGWYDLAFSYDNKCNRYYVYYAPCVTPFIDILDGETDVNGAYDFTTVNGHSHSGVLSSGALPSLVGTQYTDLKLLYEKEGSCFEADDKIHMQNVMLFDDFMTTMDFNFTRRLCHYWNAKTSGVWPK